VELLFVGQVLLSHQKRCIFFAFSSESEIDVAIVIIIILITVLAAVAWLPADT
jgi:hypothetical protein